MTDSDKQSSKRGRLYIVAFSVFLILAASGLVSFLAMGEFERVLVPELDKKSYSLGTSVQGLIIKSVGYGIPVDKLNGVREYFDTILNENPELKYIALTDKVGEVLFTSSGFPRKEVSAFFRLSQNTENKSVTSGTVDKFFNTSLPIIQEGTLFGFLHLGISKNFVRNRIKEIGYDILTVLLITFLLTFELLLLTFSGLIDGPIKQLVARFKSMGKGRFANTVNVSVKNEFGRIHQQLNLITLEIGRRLQDIEQTYSSSTKRLPENIAEIAKDNTIAYPDSIQEIKQERLIEIRGFVFLFFFSAMFPASFLPLYIGELYQPNLPLSKELVLSLPFALYYVFTALAIIVGGPWSEKIGRRKPMIVGALLNLVGYVATAYATDLIMLTLCYSTAAIGFGLVMVSCQGYAVDNSTPDKKASAIAMFWAGFFSGTLCGNGIGGILAERVGYSNVFFIAAFFSLVVAVLMARLISEKKISDDVQEPESFFPNLLILLRNARFLSIAFGLSIPAKIIMTGFIFYLTPKFLALQDVSQSNIGRVIMIYSLMFVFAGPVVSRFFERLVTNFKFTFLFTLLSGGALIWAAWMNNIIGLVIGIAFYAFFRSSCTASSTALILEVCKKEVDAIGAASVIAVASTFERIGNILGPILSGLMIAYFGYQEAIAGYGLITIAGGIFLMLSFFRHWFFFGRKISNNLEGA